ncbi:MAG: apolipoprotein N-acyltransferase, partial [Nocardioides sp.]|nr:apolipoprotein N-acyltransferase [Nocardioides sp.]
AERRRVLANHVETTSEHAAAVERGAAPRPDLVFWPENSSDIDPFRDADAFAAISGAAQAVGAPLLTGLVVDDGAGWRNRLQVWTEDGVPADAYYDKQKAVPFGEYVPFRSVLQPLVPALDQIPRDMLPGGRLGLLDVDATRIGVLTCFEIAYSGLQTGLAARDAEILLVPTNNATYMGTAQVDQQFAMARLAAVTTHRPVVVVATNGVSAIVAADGSVIRQAPVRTSAVLTAALAPRTGSTPAVALATPLAWGFTLPGVLLLALLVAGGLRGAVRRRTGTDGAGQEHLSDPGDAR